MSTISAGTTSTTALVNTGDTTGNLVFQTNGTTTAMTIDTSQNVMVGGASPYGKITFAGGTTNASSLATSQSTSTLYIQPKSTSGYGLAFGSGPGDLPYIQQVTINGAASGDMLLQPYGGNVGIGTSSPGALLDVRGSNVSVGQNTSFVQLRTTTAQAADVGAALQLGGMYDGSNSLGFAEIAGRKENSTSGNWSGYLQFATRQFGGSFAERMRIDSSGNLLVGTTTANGKISLYGTAVSTAVSIDGTGRYKGFELYDSGVRKAYFNNDQTNTVTTLSTSYGTLVFATSDNERARINSSGTLLVGTATGSFSSRIVSYSTSSYTFESTRTGTGSEGHMVFSNANGAVGSIFTNGSATAYNTSSDYRLKDNPQPLTGSGAFIDALKPKTWQWKVDGSRGVGFIAHEVQEVSPSSVVGEKDGKQMQAMEYGSAEFVANIVAELQSLRARVAALEGAK